MRGGGGGGRGRRFLEIAAFRGSHRKDMGEVKDIGEELKACLGSRVCACACASVCERAWARTSSGPLPMSTKLLFRFV